MENLLQNSNENKKIIFIQCRPLQKKHEKRAVKIGVPVK